MGFLLWFIIGVLVDRYLFPLLDVAVKAYNYKIGTFIYNESLSCKKKEFEFTKEVNEYNKANEKEINPNLIGFKYSDDDEDDIFDDDEEEDESDRLKIKRMLKK